jgi:hypothetical protein
MPLGRVNLAQKCCSCPTNGVFAAFEVDKELIIRRYRSNTKLLTVEKFGIRSF